jgi:hypothetical protein
MTQRRLVIGVIVPLALAAGVWVASHLEWGEIDVPVPIRGEARTNPFYAAQQLARQLGASARSEHLFVAPSENGVMVLSGWRWALSPARSAAVERWVESGGRLVVDRTVTDDAAFQRWSGIAPVERGAATRPRRTVRDVARPGSLCRLVVSDVPGEAPWQICGSTRASALRSTRMPEWTLRDADGLQLVRVRIGRGSVTAVNAKPFTEFAVFEGNDAALMVVATELRVGDEVRFLTEGDAPSLLALAWQRGSPVVVLLGLIVAAWLWHAAARFGPLSEPEGGARRSLEDQIRGIGEFTRRCAAGDPLFGATQRALNETAGRRIPGYGRLAAEERATALSRATAMAPDRLVAAMQWRTVQARRLAEAVHVMETARRRLLDKQERS